jgi:type VII secretion-associated serine protease mycosin
VKRLDPSAVWPLTRGYGVTVAVVDSGVSAEHPQLRDAVEGGRNVLGDGTPATTDCFGHGTLVAGIIAGRGAAGTGFTGLAPEAKILPVKALESIRPEQGGESALARGIDTAVDEKVDVINVSATSTVDAPALRRAVERALDADIVVVAAVGNDEGRTAGRTYPAAYPGVLAVAAVQEDGTRADFSRIQDYVAVAAPGAGIVAPAPTGDGYVRDVGGTSFATPYVSGVAALVRSYRPRLHAAEVVERITATADRPGSGPDDELGHGVVNLYQAVTALLPTSSRAPAARAEKPPPPDDVRDPLRRTKNTALLIAGGGAVLVVVAALAAAVLPPGRRRGWRPLRRRAG